MAAGRCQRWGKKKKKGGAWKIFKKPFGKIGPGGGGGGKFPLQNDPARHPPAAGDALIRATISHGLAPPRQGCGAAAAASLSRSPIALIRPGYGVRLHDYGCSAQGLRREVVADSQPLWRTAPFPLPAAGLHRGRLGQRGEGEPPRRRFGRSKYGIVAPFRAADGTLLRLVMKRFLTRPNAVSFGSAVLASLAVGLVISLVFYWAKADLRCDIGNGVLSWPFSPSGRRQLFCFGLLARNCMMRNLSRKPRVGRSIRVPGTCAPSQVAAAAAEPPACTESDQPRRPGRHAVDRIRTAPAQKGQHGAIPDSRAQVDGREPIVAFLREGASEVRARKPLLLPLTSAEDPTPNSVTAAQPVALSWILVLVLVLVFATRLAAGKSHAWAGPPGPKARWPKAGRPSSRRQEKCR